MAEIFRTAQIQNYDLSVSGGTSSTKYFIGSGFTTQESIIRPIDFSRFSLRVNLDQDISEKVKVGVSNAISRTFRNQARAGDRPRGGLLQAALHTPTIEAPYNEAGEFVGRAGFDNVSLLIDHYDVSAISLRYIGNVYAEADLAPGLKFRTSFGADSNNYNETEYWNTFLIEGANGGLATSTQTQFTSLINEQVLSYKNTLGANHTFGFLLGNTLQNDLFERTYAEGRGFPNNDFKLISSAAVAVGNQNWSNNTLVSFFSRVDYNYKRKFLVDFSLRADGSSRFGRENKWGYFPAVGTAYRISDEPFFVQNPVISDLKVKASYGTVGN